MARISEVNTNGFATLKNQKIDLYEDIINFVDKINGELVVADPEVAKAAIKSILLNEIGEYVRGAFRLTCDNINVMIERYNGELLEYTKTKINSSAQELAEQLVSRITKDKMSKDFINQLIIELDKLKNKDE
jgi:hypothetical protein